MTHGSIHSCAWDMQPFLFVENKNRSKTNWKKSAESLSWVVWVMLQLKLLSQSVAAMLRTVFSGDKPQGVCNLLFRVDEHRKPPRRSGVALHGRRTQLTAKREYDTKFSWSWKFPDAYNPLCLLHVVLHRFLYSTTTKISLLFIENALYLLSPSVQRVRVSSDEYFHL